MPLSMTSGLNQSTQQLTTICPLKDRPEHFRRFLISLDLIEWRQPVLFLDGSRTDQCEAIWSNQGCDAPESRSKYVRFPVDTGWPQFLSKMSAGLDQVATEFVHLTCDDDFPDENSLMSACEMLHSDSDVSLVSGVVMDFEVRGTKGQPNRDVYGDFFLERKHMNCSGRYAEASSISYETIQTRLQRQSQVWPYEGVWRTDQLKEVFFIAKKAGVTTYRTLLPVMRTVVLARGKVHHSERIFTLRQDNTRDSDGASMIASHPSRREFFLSDDTATERQSVTTELARLAFAEEGCCGDSIAAAAWQFHDLLDEAKKLTAALDQSAHDKDRTLSRLRSRLKSRLPSRIVERGARLIDFLSAKPAVADESRDGTPKYLDWYPGDKRHVAALAAAVESLGRVHDAHLAFRLRTNC